MHVIIEALKINNMTQLLQQVLKEFGQKNEPFVE